MSRPVSSATSTAIGLTITRPLYLVQLGFDVPVRLSSREQVTYTSLLWTAASLKLAMGGNWSVEIFNEALLLGQTVLTQGTAGRTAKVYQLYGDGPTWADEDGELLLDGEMGEAVITTDRVSIVLKHRGPQRTPRIYFNPPTFNYLPPDGLIITTGAGTTTLEKRTYVKRTRGL